MTSQPDNLGFEPMRIAMGLLLADLNDDDETAALIIATTADPWPVLRWALTALTGWFLFAGHDPADFARRIIARTVEQEAQGL